jgi:hypothetical protein
LRPAAKGCGRAWIVTIADVVFTPNGLMYRIAEVGQVQHLIAISAVEPLHGASPLARFNPYTYQCEPCGIA